MADLWAAVALSPAHFVTLALIAFLAGVIRGFTGFALSAFALSTAVLILPPVELIPMLFWLEAAASLFMLRAGLRDADKRAAMTLLAGAAVGTFIGIGLTVALDTGTSRIIALALLIGLAALQLVRLRMAFLATPPGTVAAGFAAGIANGLAGVGGMVVALYVLARDAEPHVMRATLVLYLFMGMLTSMLAHLWWGTMTQTATTRGLALLPVCLTGVWLGSKLFTPSLQPYYKAVCLWLLIGLALVALARTLM